MKVNERSDQKSDILPHYMAAHARLKNEFTEDKKYHNPMTWRLCMYSCRSTRGDRNVRFFFGYREKYGVKVNFVVFILK